MPTTEIIRKPSVRAHHIIRVIHTQMIAEGLNWSQVAKGAGVGYTTIKRWWDGSRQPKVDNLEAVLNYLGLTLKVTPLEPGKQKWADKPDPPLFTEAMVKVKKIKLKPRAKK